jgi:hypothetical protein
MDLGAGRAPTPEMRWRQWTFRGMTGGNGGQDRRERCGEVATSGCNRRAQYWMRGGTHLEVATTMLPSPSSPTTAATSFSYPSSPLQQEKGSWAAKFLIAPTTSREIGSPYLLNRSPRPCLAFVPTTMFNIHTKYI